MYFYRVWVRSPQFHGQEALTYCSPHKYSSGAIVKVPLQRHHVLGVIFDSVPKPNFKTKELEPIKIEVLLPKELLMLAEWVKEYYASSIGSTTQLLLPPAISDKQINNIESAPSTGPDASGLPELTAEQKSAVARVNKPDTYLLHGKTGSGKTRVYIELALKALAGGRSAIILTPEIGLTSQLSGNFSKVFGQRVVVMHSSLTPAERQKAWLRVLYAKNPLVVIGPRSALFSPLANVGLIVMDEAHEPAYKQEQTPRYQTARVAACLARFHNAQLVLGSATPSIIDYFLAEHLSKRILKLNKLPGNKVNPTDTTVVDIKNRDNFGRSSHLSTPLIKAVDKALGNQEQVLLYLNRRGTARMVLCENCGWQALCPNCNLPLTYHGDTHNLRCHTCGHTQPIESICPACSHPTVTLKVVGTKSIAEEISRLFPQARVKRFDTDNTKLERLEQHYAAIRNGDVDILVGTQLVAKGLDLPKLSTIGVILADVSLYLPDFSANERTYQLLTQVLGRTGRSHHRSSTAIIQTYHPNHPTLQAAIQGNWEEFYQSELTDRRNFLFPPFCHLLKLSCQRSSAAAAEKAANKLKDAIRQKKLPVKIEGPAPSFHDKFRGKFQWQLVVKATNRKVLLSIIELLPSSGWAYDIDPIDLL